MKTENTGKQKIPKNFRDSDLCFKDYFVNRTDIFLSTALSSLEADASTVANWLPYPSAPVTCGPTPCFSSHVLI